MVKCEPQQVSAAAANMPLRRVCMASLLVVTLASSVAGAQVAAAKPLTLSPFNVDPVADTVAFAALLAVWGLLDLVVKPTLRGGLVCDPKPGTDRCDPAGLSAFDRLAVDQQSNFWFRLTDVTAVLSYLLPISVLGAESLLRHTDTPTRDFFGDTMIIAQSVFGAGVLTNIFKFAVRRPRPTQYSDGRFIGSSEHQLSFPSGHATTVTAATTAFSTTYALRHPDSPWRFAVIGSGVILSGLTAYGRVVSGYHFPSDVLAGMAIGAAVGFLVPYLHRQKVSVEPMMPMPTVDALGRARPGMPLGLSFSGGW